MAAFAAQERERLREALFEAFPEVVVLSNDLVTGRLDENLHAIVATVDRNLTQIVNGLIEWARRSPGGVQRLVAAACAARPQDRNLAQIAADWDGIDFGVRLVGLEPTVDKRTLRRAITKAFTGEALKILCSDVEALLSGDGIDLQVNLDMVGGEGKEVQILNLIEYLDTRTYLPYLEAAVREARPGLV
jgi:hypothetical protein